MKKIAIIVVLIGFLTSCTKVINVDLNNTNPQNVMEGVLYVGEPNMELRITKTTSYFNPKDPIGETDAIVTLTDGRASYSLSHFSDGFYYANDVKGKKGRAYTLNVKVGPNQYSSTASMPSLVNIEHVEYARQKEEEEEELYGVNVSFTDPADTKNYYIVRASVEDNIFNSISQSIIDDIGINGKYITEFVWPGSFVTTGDTIIVELLSIDKGYYNYLRTLKDISGESEGGPGEAAPANPITGWNNGGLGYFGCANIARERIIVP